MRTRNLSLWMRIGSDRRDDRRATLWQPLALALVVGVQQDFRTRPTLLLRNGASQQSSSPHVTVTPLDRPDDYSRTKGVTCGRVNRHLNHNSPFPQKRAARKCPQIWMFNQRASRTGQKEPTRWEHGSDKARRQALLPLPIPAAESFQSGRANLDAAAVAALCLFLAPETLAVSVHRRSLCPLSRPPAPHMRDIQHAAVLPRPATNAVDDSNWYGSSTTGSRTTTSLTPDAPRPTTTNSSPARVWTSR